MSTQVTLTLPDPLWECAELLAQRMGRNVADLLAETIELSLGPLRGYQAERPVETWPDGRVLAETDVEMSSGDDQRLSDLLEKQQARALTAEEQAELGTLMQMYQRGLFRKAQAVQEAVRRGLRESPLP